MTRIEIEDEPGRFMGGSRVRRLLQAGRAQVTSEGKLRWLRRADHESREPLQIWGSYSSSGAKNYSPDSWLDGFLMNGAAFNRREA